MTKKYWKVKHWALPKRYGIDNSGNKVVITEYKEENGKTITTTEKVDNKIVDIKTENTTDANGNKLLVVKYFDASGNIVKENNEVADLKINETVDSGGKKVYLISNSNTGEIIKTLSEDEIVTENADNENSNDENSNNGNNNNQTNNEDNNQASTKLPFTGNTTIAISVSAIGLLVLIGAIELKKYKGV